MYRALTVTLALLLILAGYAGFEGLCAYLATRNPAQLGAAAQAFGATALIAYGFRTAFHRSPWGRA